MVLDPNGEAYFTKRDSLFEPVIGYLALVHTGVPVVLSDEHGLHFAIGV